MSKEAPKFKLPSTEINTEEIRQAVEHFGEDYIRECLLEIFSEKFTEKILIMASRSEVFEGEKVAFFGGVGKV